MCLVVYTDLSGKEPHRQADMGVVVTSESLGGVMVSILALECKRCWFDSHSMCNICHLYHSYDTGAVTWILYKLCTVWLMNLPCVYVGHCLYVCN